MSLAGKGREALLAVVFIAIFVSVQSQAEKVPGVTGTTIRIGSCSALSGPASFLGIQTQMGALAYFHLVNDAGGCMAAPSN
jgi:ABC-type branched-subunit amino acid transport system substrate-binding protein